ncbi:cytochrome P450 [Microbacterium sp. NPDC077184]|uniref:cytochrome P450 n=1 Tax=Microbacterium sp. NPDC077184 TaxID=3154764 RepID=UPI00343BECE1
MNAPTSSIDLFSDDVLADPYAAHRELRETAAAVYMETCDAYAIPRYKDVHHVLATDTVFSSRASISVNPAFNKLYEGAVIASDGEEHSRLRSVLSGRLAPRALRSLRADIAERADRFVDGIVARGSFDAVTDFAKVFPVTVVADLVGVPEEGREHFLDRADRNFNLFGPDNARARASLGVHDESYAYVSMIGKRENLAPGSFGATIYEAIDAGIVTEPEGWRLLITYLFAGMDTTINAIGHAIWLFGRHPEQWQMIRANRELIPAAFEEVLRFESPVQVFTRGAVAATEIDGVRIPEGARVLTLFGSANRDPRQWSDPDTFDIRRDTSGHLGFGHGRHGCAGQGLARIEAVSLLSSLADRVDSFDTGVPFPHLNNAVRGLASLPVAVSFA